MSLLIKPATKLSQLKIDTGKDWNGKGIANLKELASGMSIGDVVCRGPTGVLVKISPGALSQELTAKGPSFIVQWADPPGR